MEPALITDPKKIEELFQWEDQGDMMNPAG